MELCVRRLGMVALAVAGFAWSGCREKAAPSVQLVPDAAIATAAPPPSAPVPEPEVVAPPYGDDVRSLRLKRSIVVRAEPDSDGKARGTVAQDTRVPVLGWARGSGCEGLWIEIQPSGFVCDRYLEASKKPPQGVELPKLAKDELVPGLYGKLIEPTEAYKKPDDVLAARPSRTLAGQVKVRMFDMVEVDNKLYWRITGGELVAASKIQRLTPSDFEGVELSDQLKLPLAWVVPRKDVKLGHRRRKVLAVLEEDAARDRVRVGPKSWLDAADVRVARVAAPPPGLRAGERWLDVDTDQQTLVAYQGDRPVFATLVSTGKKKWPTKPGVYRIYVKFAETDMSGQMGDEEPYSVATVPWTQFFAGDLALHTAYWHDGFGEPRSHGCVNLSPKDARRLYQWSEPRLAPGYSMAHGFARFPGSIVRIKNAENPEPEPQGYAKRMSVQ